MRRAVAAPNLTILYRETQNARARAPRTTDAPIVPISLRGGGGAESGTLLSPSGRIVVVRASTFRASGTVDRECKPSRGGRRDRRFITPVIRRSPPLEAYRARRCKDNCDKVTFGDAAPRSRSPSTREHRRGADANRMHERRRARPRLTIN